MRTLEKMRANDVPSTVDLSRSALCEPDQFALLGTAVMCNNTVRHLLLDHNRLGAAGAAQLAAGLAKNTTLCSLGLENTELGKEGLDALEHALETNETLTELAISEVGSGRLRKLVQLNATVAAVRSTAALRDETESGEDGSTSTWAVPASAEFNRTLRQVILDAARLGKFGCVEEACALGKFSDATELLVPSGTQHTIGPAALLLQHNSQSSVDALAAVLSAGFCLDLAVRNLVGFCGVCSSLNTSMFTDDYLPLVISAPKACDDSPNISCFSSRSTVTHPCFQFLRLHF